MNLETSLKGLMDAKQALQSREAIISLPYLSEQMDRLATYASAVEDNLADLEEALEIKESEVWKDAVKEGSSPSAAETIAKRDTATERAQVKRLTRMVASSWKLVGVKQSRFNHLSKEMEGKI